MKQVTLLTVIALTGCVVAQAQTQSKSKTQKGNFDLGRLIGGEPLWQKIDQNLPQVQQLVDNTKQRCLDKLGMPSPQRTLIREPHPTPKEKCLIECVLTGIDLVSKAQPLKGGEKLTYLLTSGCFPQMDGPTRLLNVKRVSELASMVTEDNKLAIALSAGAAQNCNRCMTQVSDPCEAAHLLNQCIGRQLQQYRVNLKW